MITVKLLAERVMDYLLRRLAQAELQSIERKLDFIRNQRQNDFLAECALHRRSAELSLDLARQSQVR